MRFVLAFFLGIWMLPIMAQENYSFLTDRRFFEPTDLVGYQFVPQKMEIPQESKTNLKAGAVSFGITNKNLYVKGEGIKGVYNINNINATDYGYKLDLLNPRNPASTGHLKVILTKGAYADALVFKKDNNAKEIIFVLPEISDAGRTAEKAFFTDWGEVKLEFPEDVWGQKIRPFIRITQGPKIQERLFASDSVKIYFEHVITEIDKSKPSKEVVAAVEEESVKEEEDVVEEVAEPVVEAVKAKPEEASSGSPFFSSPEPKADDSGSDSPFFSSPKPKKEEAGGGSPFFSSPKKEPVAKEKVKEKVKEVVVENEVPELEVDPAAIPPIGEEEVRKEKEKRSKIKIVENYYIHITSLMKYDDGTEEIKSKKYPIRKWVERADETARPGEEKFQIEFTGDKGKTFYLYLTTERAISSFEFANQKLLVRD